MNNKEVKLKPIELKPLKELDDSKSSGFVCDMETGICGPITEKKEKKDENNDLV